MTGRTASTDFPTSSALQASNAGGQDAFVTKFNPGGSALVYSTYLGGGAIAGERGIAVDSAGNAYVTGLTLSANFPTQTPFQASRAGFADAFLAKISGPATLQFSSATYGVNENAGIATIIVTRTGTTAGEASVDYATSNGSALAPSDYTATNGTLIFPDGSNSAQTFSIPISNNSLAEPDETVEPGLEQPNW